MGAKLDEVKLTWRQVDKYHVVSSCNEYKISKAFFPDQAKYIPYRTIKDSAPTILSNALNTVSAAKEICETDKKRREQK
jgi:hypothetical protein